MAAAIANAVSDDDLGVVGATQQMMNQIGVVLGIQVMQAVQAARANDVGSVAAYHEAYLVGAAVAALGIVAAFFVRRSPMEHSPGAREGRPGGRPSRAPNSEVEPATP
jgi:hypothetical protein